MSNKYEMIANFKIYLDEVYYLAYAGGSRELTDKQQKDWNKTLLLPGDLKIREQHKLGAENNPNIVPLRGRDLLSFIKELKFVPFFDQYFNHTKMIKLTELAIFKSIQAKSYDMALRGN